MTECLMCTDDRNLIKVDYEHCYDDNTYLCKFHHDDLIQHIEETK